jgi:hypothetical protein
MIGVFCLQENLMGVTRNSWLGGQEAWKLEGLKTEKIESLPAFKHSSFQALNDSSQEQPYGKVGKQ